MKNVILAAMVLAGIAVIATANKKEVKPEINLSISDLKKPKTGSKAKVAFEDEYEGDFKPAQRIKDKVILSDSDEGSVKSDDGDGDWDDKDNEEGSDSGSVEEVDDFTESDEDEP